MEENKQIKFKSKYNLTIGWLSIASAVFILFLRITGQIRADVGKDAVGGISLILVFFILIAVPFVLAALSTTRYEIENNVLKTRLLFGIIKEEIDLNDIAQIKYNERMLYSKDLRLFMGIKKKKTIELEMKNKEIVTIDGNVLQDSDYLILKKELSKYVKIN